MSRRHLPLVAAVPLVLLLPLLATGVMALGTDSPVAGTQVIVTGALSAAPGAPVVGQSACTPTQPTRSNVGLLWTDSQYATLTPSGAALVSGYAVGRAASPTGPFTTAATVAVTPPASQPATATDSAPSGAPATTTFVINKNGKVFPFSSSAPTTPGAVISLAKGIGTDPNAAQVTPTGTTLVVAEKGNEVQVLQVVGGVWKVVKSFTGVTGAEAVAIDPVPVAGRYTAYVVRNNARTAADDVQPITLNGAASTAGALVKIGRVGVPAAITVTPNGSEVYVADYVTHQVSYFSTAAPPATAPTIGLSGTTPEPTALAVTPDSSHVYVADWRNSVIDDISTASHTVTATVALAAGAIADTVLSTQGLNGAPNIMAVTPSGTQLYVSEHAAGVIGVLNTALAPSAPDTVAATISLNSTTRAGTPMGLALSPNGCLLYTAGYTGTHAYQVATWNNTVTATSTVAGTVDPQSMAMTPASGYLYVPAPYFAPTVLVSILKNGGGTTTLSAGVGTSPEVVVTTPSPYWYRVTATHGLWTSDPSATTMFSQGFNPGGWQ